MRYQCFYSAGHGEFETGLFVAFCYDVSLWSEITVKGGFHLCEGFMFAWKCVNNALYCRAKAVQQCCCLGAVLFLGETGSNRVNVERTDPMLPLAVEVWSVHVKVSGCWQRPPYVSFVYFSRFWLFLFRFFRKSSADCSGFRSLSCALSALWTWFCILVASVLCSHSDIISTETEKFTLSGHMSNLLYLSWFCSIFSTILLPHRTSTFTSCSCFTILR